MANSSFRDAPLGAGPESITPAGHMDSGPALRASRNDDRSFAASKTNLRAQASPLGMYLPMTHLYRCSFHS
jgi:hypothetical protein